VTGTVLVTDHVFGGVGIEREALAKIGCELREAPAPDEDTLAAHAADVDGMLVCYASVGRRVIEAAARGGCRVISRYGVGVDNVDVEAATRAGILVTYVPDYCLDEVADHTLTLLLAASRNLVDAALDVREGDWTIPRGDVHRLQGRRLALIGVGRIGRKVAERALAFGFEVAGYDPYADDLGLPELRRAETLEEALAEADVLSLHAPLSPENRHLIGEEEIALMRRSPLIINTSRGGLLDLDAATRALDEGRIGALALDVTEVEPLPPGHPLRTHPRALVTPHMSFYSAEAQDELQRRAVDEVVRALTGEPPRRPVNPEVLEEGVRS
jgi:D-3-phosphoglycerate dehydrogenase / 2-oxoglutarate reductase